MNLEAVAESIRRIPGILQANVWNHVPSKTRIYVELGKMNRQRSWNLGAGRRIIVHDTGKLEWSGAWAGAMTKNWHVRNETWDKIKTIVAEALESQANIPATAQIGL